MKIESGVPMPIAKPRKPGEIKYYWGKLSVGDSFIVNKVERDSLHTSLRQYNKANKTSIKIQTKKVGDDQYRCWRVE